MDECCAETDVAGSLQIVDVGGAHHHFLGLEVEILVSGDVDFAIRLVVAHEFGAEDGVPLEIAQSGEVGHQGDIAIGERGDQVLLFDSREALDGIGPGIEAAPDVSPGIFFFFA